MKTKITNILGWIFLIMGLIMWATWWYMATFKAQEVIGLKSNYILYSLGMSLFLFLVPEQTIKDMIIKIIKKKSGIEDEQ